MWDELAAFGVPIERRLFLGGLPAALLADTKQPAFYREWIDSFFARDIQRLFGFRDMNRFNALLEYVMRQSGGQLEVTRTAVALGITRPTVESHLRALEIPTRSRSSARFMAVASTSWSRCPRCTRSTRDS